MSTDDLEPVEDFRERARVWLAANMPPNIDAYFDRTDERRTVEDQLQRRLWDGGFAGICFPADYGGLGLTPAHQVAFNGEVVPYDMPYSLNVPTLGILAATLVDFGSHEQKARHLPAILRGEERWVQFLSEPSGGSDLAGVRTRADRDGDVFILNGSKIWSSGAYAAQFSMCLARTNWDVPKHRGLTMFLLPIHHPGVTVEQIRQVDGSMEFCQEFFDDVEIPVENVIGEVDDGWTVATRLLVHERMAVGGGSQYTSGRSVGHGGGGGDDNDLIDLLRARGLAGDTDARRLLAESHARRLVARHLVERVTGGLRSGALPAPAGSLMKLFTATNQARRVEIALTLAGPEAVVWPADAEGATEIAAGIGRATLGRQGIALGGGSNEIQRNIISERVLGLPREAAADRDVPYKDVRHGSR
ncbi:MAG: acyl-CoA dehydrogenase family protein [Actinobacteria bacterium]|nr:acyl-CoA dehydrogenase family protein [Actinomycetota bacterium]